MKPEISVVVPVLNEESVLPEFFERVEAVLSATVKAWELVFVDDGSTDSSLDLIAQFAQGHKSVKYISLSRNFGQQVALSAGIDYATGKALVLMDADLQDPPELIPRLYKKMLQGYEVVYAQRKARQGESLPKKATAWLFYRVFSRFTSTVIPPDTGDFRIIDEKVADVLRSMPEQQKFLRAQIAWAGYRQGSVAYVREARKSGKTGYSTGKMLALALDGLTSYTSIPVRFVTFSGFTVSAIAFALILYTWYVKVFTEDYVPGWASLMVTVTFLGGVQLVSVGIIGEYISRIYTNSKKRPLYVIKRSNF